MGKFIIWLVVLLAGNPVDDRMLVDRVDLIELNHLHEPYTGTPTLTQVIFWEWSADCRRYDVVDWRMVDDEMRLPFRLPNRDWCVRWRDHDDAVREVRSRLYRETKTVVDPERANKQYLEEAWRTGLKKSKVRS